MYKAKPLKFSFNALEPYLSEETVRRHYIIYTNYVKRLNDLIENNKYTLEETIKNIDEFPMENRDKILFLSSAILNHELYFENIGLNKQIYMYKPVHESNFINSTKLNYFDEPTGTVEKIKSIINTANAKI